MKYAGLGIVLLLLTAPGCLPMQLLPDAPPPKPAVVETEKPVAPRPAPVRADDITDKNAHDMANALQAELDRSPSDPGADEKPLKVRP